MLASGYLFGKHPQFTCFPKVAWSPPSLDSGLHRAGRVVLNPRSAPTILPAEVCLDACKPVKEYVMDLALFWDDVALEANRLSFSTTDGRSVEQAGPILGSRALAIEHLTMHDAYRGSRARGRSTYTSTPARNLRFRRTWGSIYAKPPERPSRPPRTPCGLPCTLTSCVSSTRGSVLSPTFSSRSLPCFTTLSPG